MGAKVQKPRKLFGRIAIVEESPIHRLGRSLVLYLEAVARKGSLASEQDPHVGVFEPFGEGGKTNVFRYP